MNYRRAQIFAVLCALAMTGAVVLAGIMADRAVAHHGGYCAEDEPCWRWPTMGNLQRGVYLYERKRVRIVDACDFAWFDFRARIDWSRTRHLPGDGFARRHGCNPTLFAPDA